MAERSGDDANLKPTEEDIDAAQEMMAAGITIDGLARLFALLRRSQLDVRTGLLLPGPIAAQANEILEGIGKTRRSREVIGAVVFKTDIVEFKRVNETLGWPAGSQFIKAKADFLRTVIRKSDLLSRFGGDEFVIFAPTPPDSSDAAVRTSIEERLVDIPQSQFFPRQIRYGYSYYQFGDDFEDMVGRIDITTDEGKNSAKLSKPNPLSLVC